MNRSIFIFRCLFNYLVLIMIVLNIHYILRIGVASFNKLPIIYVPFAYLAVKCLYYNDASKNSVLLDEQTFLTVLFGFTVINIIFFIHIVLLLSIAFFMVFLERKRTKNDRDTTNYIDEYFKMKNKD